MKILTSTFIKPLVTSAFSLTTTVNVRGLVYRLTGGSRSNNILLQALSLVQLRVVCKQELLTSNNSYTTVLL